MTINTHEDSKALEELEEAISSFEPLTPEEEMEDKIWRILEYIGFEHIEVEAGCFSNGEEEYTFYTSFYANSCSDPSYKNIRPEETREKIEGVFQREMPAEWCKHDYDCCGSYYQGRVRILSDFASMKGFYTFKVSWTQNV